MDTRTPAGLTSCHARRRERGWRCDGEGIVVGRYRCDALRTGLRCTVASTGKGFRMTPAATVRLG